MPKKFTGENNKVTAAKARKAAVAEEKSAQEQKQLEDLEWIDSDKHVLRKEIRKKIREFKKQDAIIKKNRNKLLLEEETAALKLKKLPPSKLTRNQIEANVKKSKSDDTPKRQTDILYENTNLPINEYEARSIEEAIALLDIEEKIGDKHPEKRLKAAYKSFEGKRLGELRATNPCLKLSQIKQVMCKEWKKSPNNPLNKM